MAGNETWTTYPEERTKYHKEIIKCWYWCTMKSIIVTDSNEWWSWL